MDYGVESAMIEVDRVFLDLGNPRHVPFEAEKDVIEYLRREEKVLPLAKDIVKHGLNPLEHFALIPDGDNTYFSAEGNRRLCALKLLIDPDLAPADQRRRFDSASKGWSPIKRLSAVVFKDREEVKLWLDRIHAGFAKGRGRRLRGILAPSHKHFLEEAHCVKPTKKILFTAFHGRGAGGFHMPGCCWRYIHLHLCPRVDRSTG